MFISSADNWTVQRQSLTSKQYLTGLTRKCFYRLTSRLQINVKKYWVHSLLHVNYCEYVLERSYICTITKTSETTHTVCVGVCLLSAPEWPAEAGLHGDSSESTVFFTALFTFISFFKSLAHHHRKLFRSFIYKQCTPLSTHRPWSL